jgi:hypothetical protein
MKGCGGEVRVEQSSGVDEDSWRRFVKGFVVWGEEGKKLLMGKARELFYLLWASKEASRIKRRSDIERSGNPWNRHSPFSIQREEALNIRA